MNRRVVAMLGLGALVGTFACAKARDADPELAQLLTFESARPLGDTLGWRGGPQVTLHLDSTVFHSGRRSGRIERDASSPSEFSTFTTSLPVDVEGSKVELRGWLRLDGVEGWVGLWQRQNGPGGMLGFDNMASQQLKGTNDWKEFRVEVPLDARSRTLTFGCLLSGTGRLWVDDLELLVDGRPWHEAPVRTRAVPKLEADREFDAGSRIADRQLMGSQLANLVTLGKVWGFLKYHHPQVTAGNVHWDFELFRVAPKVLEAKDRKAALRAITRWVDGLGEPAPCAPCAEPARAAVLEPRLGWLSDRRSIGDALSRRLLAVHRNRFVGSAQHFVSQKHMVGNPDFGNEFAYESPSLPDAGLRLLALYRFWNIIEYWFPYRDVMNEDWDAVLAEYIPRMLAPGTRDDYGRTMLALVARVHDGHANAWSEARLRPPVGAWHVPVNVRFLEGRAVIAGLVDRAHAEHDGLAVGDVIEGLDSVPVDSLIAKWEPYYGVSNRAALEREVARSLTAGDSGQVTLMIDRDGNEFTRTVARTRRPARIGGQPGVDTHDHPGATFRRLSDDVAYLKLSSVRAADAASYVKGAEGARCLVLDIRNYPSEFMVFALGQHLVEKRTEFAKFSIGDLANPGAFAMTSPVVLQPKAPRFEGRVAILVDETSQSQAEYTTMAFRSAPGAIVVGSTTAGADGNVSAIPLPGGLRGMISGIGVFYPDGRPTQRIGIVPDRVVRPTIAGLRAQRDEVLEAAVREVLGREMTAAERQALAEPARGEAARGEAAIPN